MNLFVFHPSPLKVSLIVAALAVTLLSVSYVAALSCIDGSSEQVVLTLESVEVDGEPQADTSVYDGFNWKLTSLARQDGLSIWLSGDSDTDNFERLFEEVP